jgi:cystathionine gamma-lyase
MTHSDDIQARFFAMLHQRTGALAAGDSISEPLVSASMYHLPDQPAPDRVYGRVANPTVQAAEARLATLEDAATLLFPSGMAAYGAVVMALLRAGDKVLLPSDGYYAARNLMDQVMAPFGVQTDTCTAAEMADIALDGYKLVIIETPTNPHLDIIDIAALAARCHAAGALLAVDNTVCTPLLQQPLDHGADIIIASDTKAAAGHSDVLMGHVSCRDAAIMERIHAVRSLAGAIPGPFESWLLLRGLETLDVRLERMCRNAESLVPLFQAQPLIKSVIYPAASHPQMSRPGFLIGVTFADRSAGERFIKAAQFVPATSFGGIHSSADRRERWGDAVPGGFLRLSIGCEPTKQLTDAVTSGLATL